MMEHQPFKALTSSNDGSISPMSSVPDVIATGKNTVAFMKTHNSHQVAKCLNNTNSKNMQELDLADYQAWHPKSPTIDLEVDDLKTMIKSNFYLKGKEDRPVTPEMVDVCQKSSLVIKMQGVFQILNVNEIYLTTSAVVLIKFRTNTFQNIQILKHTTPLA